MSDEAPTKPTLETILAELREFRVEVNQRFSAVYRQLDTIENQLFNMDIRLDRLDGTASGAHSEVMNLRADFKEFRSQFKAPA
jgi:uncharacterized coiled-coil DUF342 family protein